MAPPVDPQWCQGRGEALVCRPQAKGMTVKRLGRPRPVPLFIALTAILVALCCGGSVAFLLFEGLASDDQRLNANSFACGAGGPVDPDSELPRLRAYGPNPLRNAAIIINTGVELGVPHAAG